METREWTIRHTVPVIVTIRGRKITRVVVDDESLELADTVPADVRAILETEEWPPWEFGF